MYMIESYVLKYRVVLHNLTQRDPLIIGVQLVYSGSTCTASGTGTGIGTYTGTTFAGS